MKFFLFDMDGTLLDTLGDLIAAANAMRGAFGLPPIPGDRIRSYIGNGLGKLASRSLEGAPVDPAEALRVLKACYGEHLFDRTRPMPHVPETLAALHAKGAQMAVVTNKASELAKRLVRHFGWEAFLPVVVGGGDAPTLKPEPEGVLAALAALGGKAEEACVVGDNYTDLEAARRAGMASAFLLNGFGSPRSETPTHSLPDIRALLSLA